MIIFTHIIVTCDYPPAQLLHHPVVMVTGSQDNPTIEGQFITYTCPHGFVLTGPNASVCTENREWEPDPGQVECIGDTTITQHNKQCHEYLYIMTRPLYSEFSFIFCNYIILHIQLTVEYH